MQKDEFSWLMQNEKQSINILMTSTSTIFYLCIEGNKEHGLWLNEYNRKR
jgi:hypothetical protein